jgi:hypothetical protein
MLSRQKEGVRVGYNSVQRSLARFKRSNNGDAKRHRIVYSGERRVNEVKRGELVFEKRQTGAGEGGAFSCFDGDTVPLGTSDINDYYTFLGVSESSVRVDREISNNLINTVHGVEISINNNGWNNIRAGDSVFARVPPPSHRMYPPTFVPSEEREKGSNMGIVTTNMTDTSSLELLFALGDSSAMELLKLFGNKEELLKLNEAAVRLSKVMNTLPLPGESNINIFEHRKQNMDSPAIREDVNSLRMYTNAMVKLNRQLRGSRVGVAVEDAPPGKKFKILTRIYSSVLLFFFLFPSLLSDFRFFSDLLFLSDFPSFFFLAFFSGFAPSCPDFLTLEGMSEMSSKSLKVTLGRSTFFGIGKETASAGVSLRKAEVSFCGAAAIISAGFFRSS